MRQICDLVTALGQTLTAMLVPGVRIAFHDIMPWLKFWCSFTFGPLPEGLGACSWVIAFVIQSIGLPWQCKCTCEVKQSMNRYLHIVFVDINDVALQVVLEFFQLGRFSCQPCNRLLKRMRNSFVFHSNIVLSSLYYDKFKCLKVNYYYWQPTSLSMRLSLASG